MNYEEFSERNETEKKTFLIREIVSYYSVDKVGSRFNCLHKAVRLVSCFCFQSRGSFEVARNKLGIRMLLLNNSIINKINFIMRLFEICGISRRKEY